MCLECHSGDVVKPQEPLGGPTGSSGDELLLALLALLAPPNQDTVDHRFDAPAQTLLRFLALVLGHACCLICDAIGRWTLAPTNNRAGSAPPALRPSPTPCSGARKRMEAGVIATPSQPR